MDIAARTSRLTCEFRSGGWLTTPPGFAAGDDDDLADAADWDRAMLALHAAGLELEDPDAPIDTADGGLAYSISEANRGDSQ